MKLSDLISRLEDIANEADGDPEVYKTFAGMYGIVDFATYITDGPIKREAVIIS